MVVIGSGMLANAFGGFAHDDSVVVFASGVSNSGETSRAAFDRERTLLASSARARCKLVYFSTISVFDPSLQDTPYIAHKKAMESAVRAACDSFVVLRLPNLVGRTQNPHTLTNHICGCVLKGETVHVFRRARRHLLDVDDASTVCSRMIEEGDFDNCCTNVHVGRPIEVLALVHIFERVLGLPAHIESIDKGDCSTADNASFARFTASIGFSPPENYNERLIEKYYAHCRADESSPR